MVQENRRAFLRKAAATTTITGGLLASTQSGAAVEYPDPVLKVKGDWGAGKYLLYVDDTDVEMGSSSYDAHFTEDGSNLYINGSIDEGETHKFYSDHANLLHANLRGNVLFTVEGPLGANRYGDVDVECDSSSYLVAMTDSLSADGDTGEIKNGNQAIGSGDVEHQYYGEGAIHEIHCLAEGTGNSVIVDHNI